MKSYGALGLLILSGLFLPAASPAQSLRSALFLGNSYTYTNEIPTLTAHIASSKGDSLFHLQYCPSGYTFQLHSQDPLTKAAIASGPWDYVILQEQSELPALWPDSVAVTTYPYADSLHRMIRNNDSCSTTLFYMTWGRKYGDTYYCPVYPPVCTFEGMQAQLRESYLAMGQMFYSEVSPVGIAWKRVREQNPGIELYQSDNSHPDLNGSYLAACTFYAAIFHKSPIAAWFPQGISASTADSLQQIASETVLDSLNVWYIDTLSVHAAFTYSPHQPLCYQFNNLSLNALSCSWDFGDGSHSVLANPQHCYLFPGQYKVTLTSFRGCQSDSMSRYISADPSGVAETEGRGMLIWPNPSRGIIHTGISGAGEYSYRICASEGRMVREGRIPAEGLIDVSALKDGFYLIFIFSERKRFASSFVILR